MIFQNIKFSPVRKGEEKKMLPPNDCRYEYIFFNSKGRIIFFKYPRRPCKFKFSLTDDSVFKKRLMRGVGFFSQ